MANIERILANNAALRECVEIAENLPDAGGGNTVQIATGSFENTAEYIDCGFSPDIVCIHLPELTDYGEKICNGLCCYMATAEYGAAGEAHGRYGYIDVTNNITTCYVYFEKEETGFWKSQVAEEKNGKETYPSKTYSYNAIKYT